MRAKLFLIGILMMVLGGLALEAAPNATATPGAGLLAADQITAGAVHGCARVGGQVKCWGQGAQIANATAPGWAYQSTPVDTCASQPVGWNCTVLTNVVQVVSGPAAGHTCALVDTAGTVDYEVKCWGNNGSGQLGNNTTTDSATPVSVCTNPPSCTIPLDGVQALALGKDHTCARTASGVLCWGSNAFGQLGDGTTTSRLTPVSVSGLGSGVTSLSAGGQHTCVVDSGAAKCWGSNTKGQIGDGTTTNRATPTQVSGLTSGIANIGAGGYGVSTLLDGHSCARTTAGGVKCWGFNVYGELGATSSDTCGSYPCSKTPLNVTGLSSGVSAIAVGDRHTCALLSAATIKCWGNNQYGELGDGTTTNSQTPVGVCAVDAAVPCGSNLLGNVTSIVSGYGFMCARTSDAGVKCWGYNFVGELGNSENYDEHEPEDVILDTDRDGCPDKNELQTAVGSETSGGRRDPNNSWDYFNPTMDGLNRIDDIQKVQSQYFIDYPSPNYTRYTDRTAIVGGDPWDLGPPNGYQRVDDINMIQKQYFHDCGIGQALLPPWP